MRQSVARASWRRIVSSALIVLLCGALAALGLSSSSTSASTAGSSTTDVRIEGEHRSWLPVGDVQPYVLLADGMTAREDSAFGNFAAQVRAFLRVYFAGNTWSRPRRPPGQRPGTPV
ncbi:MAG: hypothetical protein ACRDRA_16930, partial [Pseudonocardiaceae bacterium]